MDAKEKMREALSELWDKHLPEMRMRFRVLQRAAEAIRSGELTPELRHQALEEAHKLAGALGTFGHREGSEAAQSLERMLGGEEKIEVGRFDEKMASLGFPISGTD